MFPDQMNEHNTIIFSTSNDSSYAIEAISRLELARDKSHNCTVALIGSSFSNTTKIIAKTKNVKLVEVGSEHYPIQWDYPRECYYWTLAPDIFKNYKYAIYIDGDVYCRKEPFINLQSYPLNSLAGITLKINPGITDREISIYSNEYSFNLNTPRINSGVLYMNLEYLRKNNFTNKIKKLYEWSIRNNIPRKGDDSLLWVFVKTHDWNWTYLPIEYNWIYTLFGEPTQDVVWYHANKK